MSEHNDARQRARAVHDADQALAQFRQASAEIATMFKTLLSEGVGQDAALELTKTWIMSLAYHSKHPPERPE